MPHVSKVLKAKWEKQKSFSPKAIWHELRERKENDSTGEKQKQEYMGKIGRWIGKRVFFVCLLFLSKESSVFNFSTFSETFYPSDKVIHKSQPWQISH